MKCLVVCSLLIVGAWAMPQGYNIPVPDNSLSFGGGAALGGGIGPAVGGGAALGGPISCGEGLVLDTYTNGCVAPIVTRNIYVYAAPEQPRPAPGPINVPPPKVDYNIVFVRSPESNVAAEPIIIPPPQQRTLVYVLSKKQAGGQRIIEVPAGPASNPEVYFVNYGPGENPQLPGGVDLRSALGAAAAAPGSLGGAGLGGAGLGGAGLGGAGLGGAGHGGGATGFAGDLGGFGGTGFGGDAGFGGAGQGGTTGFVGADQRAGGFGGAGQGAGSFGGFGGSGQGASGFGGGVGLGAGGAGHAGGVPLPGGQIQG